MEKIIKMNSFDMDELNKLRDFLENHQIKGIDIREKDEIVIKYDKKMIKLNEKFNYRVKLIRNKYNRQLLNIINIIDNIKIYRHISDEKYLVVEPDIDLSLVHIFSNNYADILIMALINYVGVYNFDNIFELSKEEMLELKKYKCQNNDSKYLTKLMGAYIPSNAKKEVMRDLEKRIDDSILDEMKKCNCFILICPEIIQEFCAKYFREFKECEIRDVFELYTIIFNKVLVHEIGHGVFDYASGLYDDKSESRANYFASLTFDGTFNQIIKKMTDIQGELYENPILIDDDKYDISTIVDKVYKIK